MRNSQPPYLRRPYLNHRQGSSEVITHWLMQYKKIYVYIYFFYVSCTNNSTIISICFFCELHFFCRLSPFAYFSSLLKVGIQHSGRLYSFPPHPSDSSWSSVTVLYACIYFYRFIFTHDNHPHRAAARVWYEMNDDVSTSFQNPSYVDLYEKEMLV